MPELPLPDPPLGANAVRLRPWRDADVPAIVAACQDAAIARWSPVIPFPYEERDARDWLAGQEPARREGRALELAIVAAGADDLLGAIALGDVSLSQGRAEVGYWIASDARGHGYASAAVRLLAGWAFRDLGLGRLQLTTDPENVASQRVAERCGFVKEGLLRSHLVVRSTGERRDSLVYGLLPHELR